LDSTTSNGTLDNMIAGMEESFRSIFEQSLTSFLERQVAVKARAPQPFEFKELKSSLTGEVVLAALTATEGGPGRILFALSKESAGMLADMLLMGDGKAAFSYEEHLEPIRDLFKEVMASFASELGTEVGHRISFEDIKVSLVDLAGSDFVGTGWTVSRLEIGLDAPQTIYRLVSSDFCHACFPDADVHAESPEVEAADDTVLAEAHKEMGLVLDIELPISIELGRTSMLIRDIVKLAPGSIVELDKLSGEPVDLLVNGKMFARGEVVVVEENFAIRVTELVTPAEYSRSRSN
jgi:flagellar motor switch protein FliN/FliY